MTVKDISGNGVVPNVGEIPPGVNQSILTALIAALQTEEGLAAFSDGLLLESFSFSLGDEDTSVTTGTSKLSWRTPYPFHVSNVRATCKTAPTGAAIIIDINEGGTTILSTKLSIDATELTSETAATPAVISDADLADDALITFDLDQVGSINAGTGVKVTLIGWRIQS